MFLSLLNRCVRCVNLFDRSWSQPPFLRLCTSHTTADCWPRQVSVYVVLVLLLATCVINPDFFLDELSDWCGTASRGGKAAHVSAAVLESVSVAQRREEWCHHPLPGCCREDPQRRNFFLVRLFSDGNSGKSPCLFPIYPPNLFSVLTLHSDCRTMLEHV